MDGKRICRIARTAVLSASALVLGACAGGAAPLPEERHAPPVASSAAPEYRLGTGDLVAVEVRENPDLSVRVPVRPDGHIAVPLVGDVPAGRRTAAEIAADTERELRRFIRTPRVSITVTELGGAASGDRVHIVGGVLEPTSLSHRDGMTVVELVLAAGGLNEFAAPGRARLYRSVDGERRAYPVFLDALLEESTADTNYPLAPGDVVAVPERRF